MIFLELVGVFLLLLGAVIVLIILGFKKGWIEYEILTHKETSNYFRGEAYKAEKEKEHET